ncbi:MAG: histidine--tRNA ligase [Coriobacteriales bacterium]|jgi:histidyl-tRNA synthetase|nr:histidine--tRNA ligase [Coriobacteriales bacterium]
MSLQSSRGTKDLLPQEAQALVEMIQQASALFILYGYQLLATPHFENSEVFARGIGEATDVVSKEMFNVLSLDATRRLQHGEPLRAEEKMALRPEGTAGVARAVVQHKLALPGTASSKYWYVGSMYRHERPQKGRLREFHQIGVECLGAAEPSADAELIVLLMQYFEVLGIPMDAMTLKINSMGDDNCRPAWRAQVRRFILEHANGLCTQCQQRADTNPLRAFDCKNPDCARLLTQAPQITDMLCDSCLEHYAAVKSLLTAAQLNFVEDPRLVRGLDYYTRTVFEVQVDAGLGAQNAIGGGGRYDKLLEMFGARPTPGLGFAVGLERIKLVLEALGALNVNLPSPQVFVAAVDNESRSSAFMLCVELRRRGLSAEMDHQHRSLRSQIKLADRLGSPYCLIVGPEERAQGRFTLRSLTAHSEQALNLEEIVTVLNTRVSATSGNTAAKQPGGTSSP